MAEGGTATVAPPAVTISCEEEADNKEQQINEFCMLESIFEGQMIILTQGKEFMIKINARIDGKVFLLPFNDMQKEEKEVSHLSEISLYVKFPPSYPSHTSPDCHLSARWMDMKLCPFLVHRLKTLFIPSCPVVYDWVMYLQDNMINEYSRHQMGEQKIKDDICSPTTGCRLLLRSKSLIHDMEEYDCYESFLEFQSEEHECGVCFQFTKGVSMCKPCDKCGFIYCKECLLNYCQSSIGDSRMIQLECPDHDCHEIIPDAILKKILPVEFLERYIMLRENVELNSIPGMVFCPRCKFRTVSDPESTVVMCDNDACRFPFCKTCRQTWHGPIPCPALAKVTTKNLLAEDYGGKRKIENEEDKKRRIEELQSVLWVMSNDNVRPCPSCRTHIQKSGGCNKMVCSSCGRFFCWLCGEAISGYDHFERNSKCVLFRNEDYYPPKSTDDIEGLDTLEDLELAFNTKCPRCGKIEIKSNDNNWIHCYRCSFQYCFLCGEPCFGLYHFNDEYGCKKSSPLKDDLKLKTKVRSVTKS